MSTTKDAIEETGADARDADLRGATLTRTNLESADLAGARTGPLPEGEATQRPGGR